MTVNNEKTICDILKFEGIMSQGFGLAPKIVMRDTRLSIEAKAIYCYFQSFAGKTAQAFPKRETILKELKIGKNRYYKYLQELIQYDYLRVEREKDENNWKGRNIYIIITNPQSDNPQPPEKKTVCNEKTEEEQAEKAPEKKEDASCQATPKKREAAGTLYRRLEIPALLEKYPDEKRTIQAIYSVIEDMNEVEEIRISGIVKKKDAVNEIIAQLTDRHITAVLKAVRDNREKIKNIRSWIQVCLVNSLYDDRMDQRVKAFDAQYAKAEVCKQKESTAKTRRKEQFPFLMEKEKEICSLYAQMARGKIYGDKGMVENFRRKIAAVEDEMKTFIYNMQIDPSLYSFT